MTVVCRCGREMRVDGVKGPDHWRCGCGAAVAIRRAASCVGTTDDGAACPDAVTKRFPVPLCHRHVNLLLKELRRRREEALAAQRVVYYIRRGILVKIGTTQNMRVRMAELMPDEILATEPGGRELERERHLQFQAYRRRGEWFAPHPDLLAHIEQVRATHGEPAMTGYPRLT